MSILRIDRFVTLNIRYPLLKLYRGINIRIPILMYHSISRIQEKRNHPYFITVTTPSTFKKHMKYLYDNGYNVLDLSKVQSILNSQTSDKGKNVIITFDDGYRDFFTSAFPILQEFDFPATVFLPTGYIDNKRKKFKNIECLTWDEVKELSREGIHFGSHTVTHSKNISTNEKIKVEYEIEKSKHDIEDKTGKSVKSFSYPYAFPETDTEFKMILKNLLFDSGFENGVSTRIGTTDINDENYYRKRIPVNSYDDYFLFKAKLEGGYDWLYTFQTIRKEIKF